MTTEEFSAAPDAFVHCRGLGAGVNATSEVRFNLPPVLLPFRPDHIRTGSIVELVVTIVIITIVIVIVIAITHTHTHAHTHTHTHPQHT